MTRLQISYENEIEKNKILKALSNGFNIKKISKVYRSGKFCRIYIDGECI